MTPMFAAAKQHVIQKIKSAAVHQTPFPHILIENVFPADVYAAIMQNMPSNEHYQRLIDTGRVGKGYSPKRLCFFPETAAASGAEGQIVEFWENFKSTICDEEFLRAWLDVFREPVHIRANEVAAAMGSTGTVQLYDEMFLMRDTESYSLGPHWDSPRKAISALFYLPVDERNVELGTAFYVPKDQNLAPPGGAHSPFEHFNLVAKAPFRPNTLIAFPNTPRSFHGVEPVSGLNGTRDILLYDIKIAAQAAPAI